MDDEEDIMGGKGQFKINQFKKDNFSDSESCSESCYDDINAWYIKSMCRKCYAVYPFSNLSVS
jgi:hypothetical protein